MYHIPGAPNLALLTDLHNADPAPVITSLNSHRPSLICITGDVLYGGRPEGDVSPLETQKNVLPFLSACAAIATTFMSLGIRMMVIKRTSGFVFTGVTMLDVSGDPSPSAGRDRHQRLDLRHVTDYRTFRAESGSSDRYPRQESISGIGGAVHASLHKPETGWLEEYCSAPGYHVLLSHHPEYYPLIPDSIDLILSGHAHGGQWRFFGHGVWSPGQGWWPRYTKGVYENRLVVSAGLSNTTWIPRLFNPTEVVYIEGS